MKKNKTNNVKYTQHCDKQNVWLDNLCTTYQAELKLLTVQKSNHLG